MKPESLVSPHRPDRPFEQVVIEDVRPSIGCGRFPVKAIVGDTCAVEATVFRHGHERLRVVLRVQAPGGHPASETAMQPVNPGLDLWGAAFPLAASGRFAFTVAAWTDHFASWVAELKKRLDAHQPDVASEVAEGVSQVERAQAAAAGEASAALARLLARLRAASADAASVYAIASEPESLELMGTTVREDEVSYAPALSVVADRPLARSGAWYELFVRSQGTRPGVSGTFADAERRLPDIRALGFDVVYLAPIHPIGLTNRKGANNSTTAGPGDPGSPWAIGSPAGGHTAVEPSLGTIDDFDHFVRTAGDLGLEVALDLAIQCSPDHPWVTEHPEWFYHRPDGSIRFAENPPKKYEDIYPVNFDTPDWRNLWDALLEVVRFWVAHGVTIFRVDNPHTKPVGFWNWLIETIQRESPGVIFLAEAFTRPPMMLALGRRGFTQSYTYFTWRNTKAELTQYMSELLSPAMVASYRPNFFANTPDILPPILQQGGRPAFKSRLVLAATLSPTYGIYSGYELCENEAIPGREEYLHSEKYEIKVRDWHAPGNINEFIRRVNEARHENPALQRLENLRFLDVAHPQLLAYAKTTPDCSNAVIVVVNLDPFAAHASVVNVPPEVIGLRPGERYDVFDVLSGRTFRWETDNYVSLDPLNGEPAHLLVVRRSR